MIYEELDDGLTNFTRIDESDRNRVKIEIYQEIVELLDSPVRSFDFYKARIDRDIHAKKYDRMVEFVEYLARRRIEAGAELDALLEKFRYNVALIVQEESRDE